MSLLAACVGVAVLGGIAMLIAWFRPAPTVPTRQRKRRVPLSRRWERLGKRMQTTVVLGVLAGIIVGFITQLPALLLAVPAAIIGLPLLLGQPDNRDRELTAALEAWSRALSAAAETGAFTLHEVIGLSRGSAPEILRGPINRLHARMSSTWSPSEAFGAFADELDSDRADEVVLYLMQAAEYSAHGLATALASVADALQQQMKLQTEVFFEREKPRRSLVTMTWIAAVTVVVVVVASGSEQMAFYRTPVGAFVMALLLGCFVLILAWAKSITRVKPTPRSLLVTADQGERVS